MLILVPIFIWFIIMEYRIYSLETRIAHVELDMIEDKNDD
jgi:hypothetical protein